MGINVVEAAAEMLDKISRSVAQRDSRAREKQDSSGSRMTRALATESSDSGESWKLSKRFINKHVGMGLIADEFIPSGSTIYCDYLMVVSETERKMHCTPKEFDAFIAKKVAAQDPRWQEGFAKMPNTRENVGRMGGVWEASHLPLSVNGEPCEMLGLNLAFTNHSCLPNSTLSLFHEHPTINGKLRTDKRPRLGGAVVKNFLDIHEGQEITVSYFYSKGEANYRRLYALEKLGFRCACAYCRFPDPLYEQAQRTYARLDRVISDPKYVCHKPSLIFQATLKITGDITNRGVVDPRIALLWMKCALVAGFHSDIGRVRVLLTMSNKLVEIMQGASGYLSQRSSNWLDNFSLMPGFGATLRGLSSSEDAGFFAENSLQARMLLFMAGIRGSQYMRLDYFRDFVNACCELDESIVGPNGSDTKEKQDQEVKKQAKPKTAQKNTRKRIPESMEKVMPKPRDKPVKRRIPKSMEKVMPKPRQRPTPKPMSKITEPMSKTTEKAARTTEPNVEPKQLPQGDEKKKKKKKKCKSKAICKRLPRETCTSPEHDFLTLFTHVVNDFIDHGSHEHTGQDRNGVDDSNSMERATHEFNLRIFESAKEALLNQTASGQKSTTDKQSAASHKPGVSKKAKGDKVVSQ